MKGPGFRRRLGAYRDGALPGAARQRMQQQLEADPEAARWLRDMEHLGEAVRATWSDAPQGPDPDQLLASLRPALSAVDAELDSHARPPLRERFAALLSPAPSRVFAGAALAGLLLVGMLPFFRSAGPPSGARSILPAVAEFRAPDTIYDLGQAEVPVMVFESEDGATVVWMLDDEPDLISRGRFSGNV